MAITLDRVSASDSATDFVEDINNILGDIEEAFEQSGDDATASGYTEDIVPKLSWFRGATLDEYGRFKTSQYGDLTPYIRISPATNILVKVVSNGTAGYKEGTLISFFADTSSTSLISSVGASNITSAGTIITAPDDARYMRLTFASQYVFSPPHKNIYSVQFEIASFLRCITEDIQPKWRCLLPKYIDTASGKALSLFCDNFMEGIDDLYVQGYYVSRQFTERGDMVLRFGGGSNTATLKFIKKGTVTDPLESTKSTDVITRQHPTDVGDGTESKNILLIGDSLMANTGDIRNEVKALLDADGDYVYNVWQEATQGWKYANFIGSSSPFYINDGLNFQQYMSTKKASIAAGGIDYVVIGLGTNDVAGVGTPNIDTVIANAKALIDAVLDENTGYPNAKIAIGLPSPGAPYGNTQNDTAFVTKQEFRNRMFNFNERLLNEFDNGKYNANVTTTAFGAAIYGWECYSHTDIQVSPYCETTMRKFNDMIHPLAIGYKSWGFAIYHKLRAFINGVL